MGVSQIIRRGFGALQQLVLRGLGQDQSDAGPPSALKSVSRFLDEGKHGSGGATGYIIGDCATTVFTNNLETAKDRCEYLCFDSDHGGTYEVISSSQNNVEGVGIVRVGDETTCGAIITQGSDNVFSA